MILRGKSQGQEHGESGRMKRERGERGGASSRPPISPVTLASHGREPELALLQPGLHSPDTGWRRQGALPRGVRSRARRVRCGCWAEATSRGQEGGGGAVRGAENSPRGRAGMVGHARCAVPGRQGGQGGRRQGAQDTLPRDPALAHLAPRRAEAPEQRRSAWRTRGAEQPEVWGRARRAPVRGVAGHAVRSGLPRHWRGNGVVAESRCSSDCWSAHQPRCTQLGHCSSGGSGSSTLVRPLIYPRPRK